MVEAGNLASKWLVEEFFVLNFINRRLDHPNRSRRHEFTS